MTRSERNQTQKVTYYVMPFLRIAKSLGTEGGLAVDRVGEGITAVGTRSSWGDETVWGPDRGGGR